MKDEQPAPQHINTLSDEIKSVQRWCRVVRVVDQSMSWGEEEKGALSFFVPRRQPYFSSTPSLPPVSLSA